MAQVNGLEPWNQWGKTLTIDVNICVYLKSWW